MIVERPFIDYDLDRFLKTISQKLFDNLSQIGLLTVCQRLQFVRQPGHSSSQHVNFGVALLIWFNYRTPKNVTLYYSLGVLWA